MDEASSQAERTVVTLTTSGARVHRGQVSHVAGMVTATCSGRTSLGTLLDELEEPTRSALTRLPRMCRRCFS